MFFYEFPLLDTNIRTLIAARAPLPNSGWYSSLTPFVTSETGRNLERLSSCNRSWDTGDQDSRPPFCYQSTVPQATTTMRLPSFFLSLKRRIMVMQIRISSSLGFDLRVPETSRGLFLELKAFLFLTLWKPSALQRVAKGLCVTRDERQNLYVTRESYLKRNVIREYLNACDAWFIAWGMRDSWIICFRSWKSRFPEVFRGFLQQ